MDARTSTGRKRLNRINNFNQYKFMKKKHQTRGGHHSHFKRLLFIMKLTIFLIFSGLMSVSASIYSQSTKLSLELNDVSILDLFKQIESQSEFVFIYKNEVIDVNKSFSIFVSLALLKFPKDLIYPYFLELMINSPFVTVYFLVM